MRRGTSSTFEKPDPVGGLLQDLLQAHDVVELLPRRRHGAALEAVLQPDLQRVLAHLLGQLVHHRLDGEIHLRRAEPAHRAGVVVVRVDGVDVRLDVLAAVGAGRLHDRAPRHERAHRGIRAAVGDAPDLHRGDRAVLLRPPPVVEHVGVALVAFQHRLLARVHHLDRPAGGTHKQRRAAAHRGHHFVLPAERAAERRLDDLHPVQVKLQRRGDRTPAREEVLYAAGDPDAAVLGRLGQHRFRLDRRMLDERRPELPLEDEVGLRQTPSRRPLCGPCDGRRRSLRRGSAARPASSRPRGRTPPAAARTRPR